MQLRINGVILIGFRRFVDNIMNFMPHKGMTIPTISELRLKITQTFH